MFKEWLKKELIQLRLDVGVYHSYLLGILEDNIDEDEQREMITDILSSLIESNPEQLVNTIFEKWKLEQNMPATPAEQKPANKDLDIAELLQKQAAISQAAAGKQRKLTEEERRIKQQILASYSQCSDKEDNDEDDAVGSGAEEDPDMEKNTNKSDVQKLAREKREQAKLESEQKKLKDKEDRAKQKAIREEKKSKRQNAAAKGERKR